MERAALLDVAGAGITIVSASNGQVVISNTVTNDVLEGLHYYDEYNGTPTRDPAALGVHSIAIGDGALADDAYTIVTRVFRGGGFTKDYLYLSGFVDILRMWENDRDLTPLLVGKTSLNFYQTISEMIQREMIQKPVYITKSFKNLAHAPTMAISKTCHFDNII